MLRACSGGLHICSHRPSRHEAAYSRRRRRSDCTTKRRSWQRRAREICSSRHLTLRVSQDPTFRASTTGNPGGGPRLVFETGNGKREATRIPRRLKRAKMGIVRAGHWGRKHMADSAALPFRWLLPGTAMYWTSRLGGPSNYLEVSKRAHGDLSS